MAEVSPDDVLTALFATPAPGVFLTGLGGSIVLEEDDGPLLALIFNTGAGLRVSSGLPWIQEASNVISVKVTSSLVGVEQAFLDPVLSGVLALLSPVT